MSGGNAVSVIIAAMNAEESIGRAVQAALAEDRAAAVVVVDDGSRDNTIGIARAADDGTHRLTVVSFDQNRGPAAARNYALDLCTSPYVCILDADDYFQPGRIARLLSNAPRDWDLLADDVVIVPEDLQPSGIAQPVAEQNGTLTRIDLETFLVGNLTRRGRPRGELGFLKPIIRLAFLNDRGLRYDEGLRLGEDYALYSRALMAGGKFFMAGRCGYVAIERQGSLSSCHSAADLSNLARFDASCLLNANLSSGERQALKVHHAATVKRAVYAKALEIKRDRGMVAALGILARQPSCVPHVVAETVRAKGTTLFGWSKLRAGRPGVRLLSSAQPLARRDELTVDASSAPRSEHGLDRLRSDRSRRLARAT